MSTVAPSRPDHRWRKARGARATAWGIVIVGVAVAVIAAAEGLLVGRPTLIELAVLAPESAAISAVAYVVGLRPLMESSSSGLIVRNCLSTTRVAWSEVSGVAAERIGLVVYRAGGRLPVSAVPAGGRKHDGQSRAERVADTVSELAAGATHVDPSTLLRQPPALSASEQRSERIAVAVGMTIAAIWIVLMVQSLVGGH